MRMTVSAERLVIHTDPAPIATPAGSATGIGGPGRNV
jgi:hypothetical protein